jgi:cytochrome c oxidase assembly protein Cox11
MKRPQLWPLRTRMHQQNRWYSKPNVNPYEERRIQAQSTMYYAASVIVTFIGLSFAAVPLYQLFCSTTGIDGTPKTGMKEIEFDTF